MSKRVLTKKQVKKVVRKYSYKQGWRFKVIDSTEDHPGELGISLITDWVRDSCDPNGEMVEIVSTNWLDYKTKKEVKASVRMVVDTIEQHERDEWFRYKGKLVSDPHRKVAESG